MSRGLGQNDKRNVTYVKCSQGLFIMRMSEPSKDTITRKLEKGPNKGNEVHEKHFQRLEGQLIDIKKRTHDEYGSSWEFIFDVSPNCDATEFVNLSLKYDSGYAKNILFRIENINPDEDITLSAYKFKPEGEERDRMGISIFQNGAKVDPKYTKKDNNGMPQMKEVFVSGKKMWDSTEQMQFVEEKIVGSIVSKLKGFETKEEPEKTNSEKIEDFEKAAEPEKETATSEDLPF